MRSEDLMRSCIMIKKISIFWKNHRYCLLLFSLAPSKSKPAICEKTSSIKKKIIFCKDLGYLEEGWWKSRANSLNFSRAVTSPQREQHFHHTTALALKLLLTSCVSSKMLLLANVNHGQTTQGGSLLSGDVQIDYSTCGRVRYLWPRFTLFSSTLSLCSVMRAKCSLSPVPPAL